MKTLLALLTMLAVSATSTTYATGQYAKVNGLNLYYEIHGQGTPLVLIHGGGSTIGTTFGRILPELAKRHRVIAVELQAHGHTADIDRPLSFQQDADDVAALLKQLKLGKADIFGFSNGASTTLELAIRHPELVHKIIVASTMYRKEGAYPWLWEMMSHPKFEDMPEAYKNAFLKINPDEKALYRMYERDVARMQSFPDIPEASIRSIQAPTLIILGDTDVVRPEHAVEMYRQMQHARLAIFPGGHGAYIGELTTLQSGKDSLVALPIIEEFLSVD